MPKRNPNPPPPVYPTEMTEGPQAWANFEKLAPRVIRAGKPRHTIDEHVTVTEQVTVEENIPAKKKRSRRK